jgi:hypothetical protein
MSGTYFFSRQLPGRVPGVATIYKGKEKSQRRKTYFKKLFKRVPETGNRTVMQELEYAGTSQ